MYKIAVINGDGIGPEIVKEAIKVLNKIAAKYNHQFEFKEVLMGGAAIDETGSPLPPETLEVCKKSDAVLMGAIGGPKWDTTNPDKPRPEQGLLGIRKGLELYANLRPVKVFEALIDSSTLKKDIVSGIDIIVVRELTGGIYFGVRAREKNRAYDTCEYSRYEIERIIKLAFELSLKRSRMVHSVDKANVLESSRLWREVAIEVAKDYAEVELVHQLVDNTAMQLIRNPKQFDVIVTENMFGDILSDEAAMLTGSLGMLPSVSMGTGKVSLYEPCHGSAPDIAGQGIANPLATILSAALMLRYSFNLEKEALAVEDSVEQILNKGYRTKDIMEEDKILVSTEEMGTLVVENV